jgi:6-phosphogluconolactonase
MKIPAILLSSLLLSGAARAESVRVYFGTGGEGIYRSELDLESGALSDPLLAVRTAGAGFIEVAPDRRFIYATGNGKDGGTVNAFVIDGADGNLRPLNQQPSGGSGPCHVNVTPDGKGVLVANYGSGSVSSFPVNEDGSLGAPAGVRQHEGSGPDKGRQEGPHAHSINPSPDGRFAFAADLGVDKLMIYTIDPTTKRLDPAPASFAKVAPGAGPRHFAFHPNGRFAYVINELDNTITAFSYDAAVGALAEIQTVPTLPEGFTAFSKTAEVRIHPSGKFLYGSNRGHESIAVYAVDPETGMLTFVEREPVGGKHPRNFNLDPSGRFLLAANMESDNVVVFRIDQTTGALEKAGPEIALKRPMCVRFWQPIAAEASTWRPLFDGKAFDGWEGDLNWFRIEDGAIIAGSLEKAIPQNEFLASTQEFGDFELRFEAKLVGQATNAGVQFRSQREEGTREMIGYQCDIGIWPGGVIWGAIYDESRRRVMLTEVDQEKVGGVVKKGEWNALRVRAEGRHIQIWVNDVLASDYTEREESVPQRGRFGLQIHSGAPTECSYRGLEIRDL